MAKSNVPNGLEYLVNVLWSKLLNWCPRKSSAWGILREIGMTDIKPVISTKIEMTWHYPQDQIVCYWIDIINFLWKWIFRVLIMAHINQRMVLVKKLCITFERESIYSLLITKIFWSPSKVYWSFLSSVWLSLMCHIGFFL